jgi:Flp pilus assembly pilin Flp
VSRLNRLLCEDDGQDLVEYGLLASLISIVAIVSIGTLGPLVGALYTYVHIAIRFARAAVGT